MCAQTDWPTSAYATESLSAFFRQGRQISSTTELGSKNCSLRIWSSATPLSMEVFLSLLACNQNLHGYKPTAKRLSLCLFICHLYLGLLSEVQRSWQHITLTVDARNRKELLVQRVANSLADGSQCIYDDTLELNVEQEMFIAEKIDWPMQPTGWGWKEGEVQITLEYWTYKESSMLKCCPTELHWFRKITFTCIHLHLLQSLVPSRGTRIKRNSGEPNSHGGFKWGDGTYIKHPHNVLGGSSLSCLVLPTSNNFWLTACLLLLCDGERSAHRFSTASKSFCSSSNGTGGELRWSFLNKWRERQDAQSPLETSH